MCHCVSTFSFLFFLISGNCTFDSNEFCSWVNTKIDYFDWTLGKGKTQSALTGPHDDHLGGGVCNILFPYLLDNGYC